MNGEILTEIAAAGNRTKLPVSLVLSPIEAEVSDVVESMKDKAEIAMYNALGESDMARTQASKKQKRNLQAAQKAWTTPRAVVPYSGETLSPFIPYSSLPK